MARAARAEVAAVPGRRCVRAARVAREAGGGWSSPDPRPSSSRRARTPVTTADLLCSVCVRNSTANTHTNPPISHRPTSLQPHPPTLPFCHLLGPTPSPPAYMYVAKSRSRALLPSFLNEGSQNCANLVPRTSKYVRCLSFDRTSSSSSFSPSASLSPPLPRLRAPLRRRRTPASRLRATRRSGTRSSECSRARQSCRLKRGAFSWR